MLSDEKMGLSLMNMLGVLSNVLIAHVIENSSFCNGDHAYLTYLMLQRQLSHLNGRKLDHRQF
jgi:hypothetical protein